METMMREDEYHGDRWFKNAAQQATVVETIQALKMETQAQGTPLGVAAVREGRQCPRYCAGVPPGR